MEVRVDGSLERAMRVLKKKLAAEGVFKEMKVRAFYEKPSVRRKRKRQEAERKRIEAKGVSDFQTIVSQSINANLLQWKGIEATEALSKSQNAKIVVIGSGKNGLPVILNPEKN